MPAKPRLGRPPSSSSAETKGRIIDVARACFAELGYEATTNRVVAAEAGITTGAMYHYFDSKLEIYEAVRSEVQQRVYQRFTAAERTAETFVGKLEAVLEAAHELNREDPTLAQFLGAERIDARRIPDLAENHRLGDPRRVGFFGRIVDTGVKTGEVAKADRDAMVSFIQAFTVGLTDGLSNDPAEHRLALDGMMAVLGGKVRKPGKRKSTR